MWPSVTLSTGGDIPMTERMIMAAVVRADMLICAAWPCVRAGLIAVAAGIIAGLALFRRPS